MYWEHNVVADHTYNFHICISYPDMLANGLLPAKYLGSGFVNQTFFFIWREFPWKFLPVAICILNVEQSHNWCCWSLQILFHPANHPPTSVHFLRKNKRYIITHTRILNFGMAQQVLTQGIKWSLVVSYNVGKHQVMRLKAHILVQHILCLLINNCTHDQQKQRYGELPGNQDLLEGYAIIFFLNIFLFQGLYRIEGRYGISRIYAW